MEPQAIKQKILKGEMTDEELLNLLGNKVKDKPSHKNGSFLKAILKGFIEVYTAPNMWKMTLEAILILIVITGIIFLSYSLRIDAMVTSILLAFVLGFLFGKIK